MKIYNDKYNTANIFYSLIVTSKINSELKNIKLLYIFEEKSLIALFKN